MRRIPILFTLLLLVGPFHVTVPGRAPAAPAKFSPTVDSIMWGPGVVGWAPTGLRWPADSKNLYFEWRKPGEKEPSTCVVGRDGGEPRKLTQEEAKEFPPATVRWDKAHRRVLAVDGGDVVLVDGVRGRRRITRTTAAESNPRWARNDTASPTCATATCSSFR